MIFHPQNTNLKEIITESIGVLESHAKNKQITIHSEISADMLIFVDKNSVKTVIRNLLSNAVKYTERGGKVTIRAKDAEAWLEITISDTGVGIKEEHLADLFRIDSYHATVGTAQERGTGLGLILCKEFVEKHGGKIWVESKVGNGSHFTFTLPKATNSQPLNN